MIDQQGLLHVGDIIKEVNGKEVGNDPKVLQEMLKEASGSVVLKILPSYQEPHTPRQVSLYRKGIYQGRYSMKSYNLLKRTLTFPSVRNTYCRPWHPLDIL